MISLKSWTRGATLALATLALAGGFALAAGPPTVWTARLTGNSEVPPTDSKSNGMAKFTIVWADTTNGGSTDSLGIASIEYQVRVNRLDDATAGHLHLGAEGENGPVVVNLNPQTGDVKGVIAEGTIEASDLTGPLTGMTLSDLWAYVSQGEIYVNLHTETHPGGEIRGQVDFRGGGGADF
jgi:hypothetical protein